MKNPKSIQTQLTLYQKDAEFIAFIIFIMRLQIPLPNTTSTLLDFQRLPPQSRPVASMTLRATEKVVEHTSSSLFTPKNPYVIAEMSANHGGRIENVFQLMKETKDAGVSAFKLQTYQASSLTLDVKTKPYIIDDGPWRGRSLFDVYQQGTTPTSWLPEIFAEARKLELEVFSTPFGIREVELLENFGVSKYKVASFELTYDQLLREVGSTEKTVILSTGMATKKEISHALEVLYNSGASEVALLKCTTTYPAMYSQLNLMQISQMREDFGTVVGFSDHTKSEWTGGLAVAHGAAILEKHVKLEDDDQSLDASFSLPSSKVKDYVSFARDSGQATGQAKYGPEAEEEKYLKYRRSIVAKCKIAKGERIQERHLAIVRPSIGLPPQDYELVLGCVAQQDIAEGEGMDWHLLIR